MRMKKSGPVAQLGARFHGMEEVVGSIPTRSTRISSPNKARKRVPLSHPDSFSLYEVDGSAGPKVEVVNAKPSIFDS